MKSNLSSIDIHALVEEIRPRLIGSWINNAYSIGEKFVILRFRKSTENPFELVIEVGKRFHITKYVRKKPATPNNKILMLRKHIKRLKVKDFYQLELDRIVVFEIESQLGDYKLVVEFFAEGNLILVSPENKILMAYRYKKMRDRDIHPGKEFLFPPSSETNILKLNEGLILSKINTPNQKVISVLNELLGLGPNYSKDVVLRANVTSRRTDDLTDEEKERLVGVIFELQKVIAEKQFSCYCYKDDDEIVDITPIPISRYSDLTVTNCSSFNDALDDYFSRQEEEPEFTEDKTVLSSKITKLKKTLIDQERHLENLKKQEENEKIKGDLLYANYTTVDELLRTIFNARKQGLSWSEIKDRLELGKKKNIEAAKIVEKLEPQNKTVWVKFYDESGTEQLIPLDFTKTINENANIFYEKAKKARRKVPGALEAIERTKKKLEEVKKVEVTIAEEVQTKKPVLKRNKKWYEKFRWFICEDHVVIGGKDVKTNERILKTYLEENDLFFHADVHGAPYVVVKDGQRGLSEECLREVATFALNYSSLWKDKKLVGDVFYVSPDQVSLTPPSGQYLAKGSVMIYGEKKYIKNVEINHAVGIIIHERYAQVVGGPIKSIEKQTNILVKIRPGDVPKGKIAKIIREKLLDKTPEEHRYKVEALNINDFLEFIPGDSEIME